MKKTLMAMVMFAALASLTAGAGQYAMVSAVSPAQIPMAQEHLDGVRFNIFYGECMSVNGLDVGFMGRTRESFNGLQVAACSLVGTEAAGCQLGVVNFVNAGFDGFQCGLINLVDADCAGFQLGVWNAGQDVAGFQLGVVNRAGRLSGLQVGLLNFIDEPQQTVRCLPILNFGW